MRSVKQDVGSLNKKLSRDPGPSALPDQMSSKASPKPDKVNEEHNVNHIVVCSSRLSLRISPRAYGNRHGKVPKILKIL